MKKESIIKKRLFGLASFDEAVRAVGMDKICEDAIRATSKKQSPFKDRGYTWFDFQTQFHAAWMCRIQSNMEMQIRFNLDEALTQPYMEYVAHKLGITEPYVPQFPRK